MEAIYANKNALTLAGVDLSGSYWTSYTDNSVSGSSMTAYSFNMSTGTKSIVTRNTNLKVLAIRYFGSCITPYTTTTTCVNEGGVTTTTTTASPTTTTTSTTLSPTTTTTTTTGLYQYDNCGRGNTVGAACDDAVDNARTFYSDCDPSSFGGGCTVYTDTLGTILTGFTRIFMNGSNWNINSSTGVVTGASAQQC